MRSSSTRARGLPRVVAASFFVATVVASGAAPALPPCPTWFPDFRGCDRHGRYDGFVPPMMHTYLFEDPFITTGVSAWALWHEFPDDSIVDGGDLWIGAVQARIAITDRIAFIATQDGFVDFNPGLSLLEDDTGFTDLMVGFKGSLIDDRERNLIVTPSLRFKTATGDLGVLQGNGDGTIVPAVSAGWGIDRFHVIGSFGGQFPLDTDKQSTSLFYYLHLDYAVHRFIVPFVELGGFHYLDGGDGSTRVRLEGGAEVPLGVAQSLLNAEPEEGLDYANLGSRGVAGDDVLAWSVGVRVPVNRHVILGLSYERPLTENKDVLSQRAKANVTIEF
jgi:hypothetical protein